MAYKQSKTKQNGKYPQKSKNTLRICSLNKLFLENLLLKLQQIENENTKPRIKPRRTTKRKPSYSHQAKTQLNEKIK